MTVSEHTEPEGRPRNAMSVDVEDWFQVQAFADVIPRAEWDYLPCRVEPNTDAVLAQFDAAGVRATFLEARSVR